MGAAKTMRFSAPEVGAQTLIQGEWWKIVPSKNVQRTTAWDSLLFFLCVHLMGKEVMHSKIQIGLIGTKVLLWQREKSQGRTGWINPSVQALWLSSQFALWVSFLNCLCSKISFNMQKTVILKYWWKLRFSSWHFAAAGGTLSQISNVMGLATASQQLMVLWGWQNGQHQPPQLWRPLRRGLELPTASHHVSRGVNTRQDAGRAGD